ncbi:hypothetical protein [Buchananella hordeovulneris]|uniref:hypothetical protein n=1 Tax=Buchananella hordeovulneris TaxID=52770 RepID=UPI0026DC7745|nr:hypothetical protein [Buchananella hordeovulneris]MDO5079984.1 hypothetical protein [Buchananella hordeovulneris]
MADLMVVDGDYEQVDGAMGEAEDSLGQISLSGCEGQVVGALPSSVGGAAFAGAAGKLLSERDELVETCGQTRSGVQDAIESFALTEEELAQLVQGGMNVLAGMGVA